MNDAFDDIGPTVRPRAAVLHDAREARDLAQMAMDNLIKGSADVPKAEEYLRRVRTALCSDADAPVTASVDSDVLERLRAIGRPVAEFIRDTTRDDDGDEPLADMPREMVRELLRRMAVLCDDLEAGIHKQESGQG